MTSWDEDKESLGQNLTKEREKNKEVGRQQTIAMLEELLEGLRNKSKVPAEISIEYIRDDAFLQGFSGPPPVVGEKITLYYRGFHE